MDSVVKEIRNVLHHMVIYGIKYEKLGGISYEMSRLRVEESKLDLTEYKVVHTDKSVYDYITYESDIEKKFANDLNFNEDIKYSVKLPVWFTVPSPIGNYNPDWAILIENGQIVYLIIETKSTKDKMKLRTSENEKITCGTQHFIATGVDYEIATSAAEALMIKYAK